MEALILLSSSKFCSSFSAKSSDSRSLSELPLDFSLPAVWYKSFSVHFGLEPPSYSEVFCSFMSRITASGNLFLAYFLWNSIFSVYLPFLESNVEMSASFWMQSRLVFLTTTGLEISYTMGILLVFSRSKSEWLFWKCDFISRSFLGIRWLVFLILSLVTIVSDSGCIFFDMESET